jgi:hypothetical protein
MPTFRNLQRVSPVYAAAVLDGSGRPTRPWTPTSTTREAWGRLKITVGGSDFTTYRNAPTLVDVTNAEPFGDATARLRFPAMTGFEALATGTFDDWATVEIARLHTDGVTTTPLWAGLIAGYEETEEGVVAVCMGALIQASLYVRAPFPSDAPADVRDVVALQYNPAAAFRPHLRNLALATTPATGHDSYYRGSWETSSLDFVLKVVELTLDSAGNQYTVKQDYPTAPWQPLLETKDLLTDHWSATFGTPGVDSSDLQHELSSGFNVVYGEGDYGGSTHRGVREITGSTVFQPYAYDPDVHPWDEGADGTLTADYGRVDTSLVRIEAFQPFGSGVSYTEAKASAEAQRLRAQDVGWVGTIRMSIDPEEGHRLGIRAGENFLLKGHRGVNRRFHIAAVSWAVEDRQPVVSLTVDTKARDLPTLAAIIERNREVSRRPLARLTGRTQEGTPSSRAPWDDNAGSGWVPTARKFDGTSVVALSVGHNIIKFLASESETIWKIEAHTTGNTPFGLALFNGEVTAVELPSDPFADGAWDPANYTAEDRYINHWGQWNVERAAEERAGFYPGFETDGDAATGNFLDDAPWVYTHDNGIDADAQQYLWMDVYVETACNFWAKLTKGPKLR